MLLKTPFCRLNGSLEFKLCEVTGADVWFASLRIDNFDREFYFTPEQRAARREYCDTLRSLLSAGF